MNKLAEQEASASAASSSQPSSTTLSTSGAASTNNISTPTRPAPSADAGNSRVNEHIGPVQFNMGGIQVDADEMVRKLRERGAGGDKKKEYGPGTPEGTKKQNEELA
ncbi:MAG: hypothetical protein L6R39_007717, partial [Caloplaca ligustica]